MCKELKKLENSKWVDQLVNYIQKYLDDNDDYQWMAKFFWRESRIDSVNSLDTTRSSTNATTLNPKLTPHDISSSILNQRKVNMVSENIEGLLEVMKQHLQSKDHPIKKVIDKFSKHFFEAYLPLLQKENAEHWTKQRIKEETRQAIDEVRYFVTVLMFTLPKFYEIAIKAIPINKRLVEMALTNIVLKDKVYEIIFFLICKDEEDSIRELTDKVVRLHKITLQHLELPEYFQLDPEFRERVRMELSDNPERLRAFNTNESPLRSPSTASLPYGDAIRQIKNVISTESPIDKFESVYHIKECILNAVNTFWEGVGVQRSKLFIDPDSLLGIITYIVIKSQYPKIICEYRICDEFLPHPLTSITNKGLYLTNLRASVRNILTTLEDTLPKDWEVEIAPSQLHKHQRHISCVPLSPTKLMSDDFKPSERITVFKKNENDSNNDSNFSNHKPPHKSHTDTNIKIFKDRWAAIDEEMVLKRYQEAEEAGDNRRHQSMSCLRLPGDFTEEFSLNGLFGSFMGIEPEDKVIVHNFSKSILYSSRRAASDEESPHPL